MEGLGFTETCSSPSTVRRADLRPSAAVCRARPAPSVAAGAATGCAALWWTWRAQGGAQCVNLKGRMTAPRHSLRPADRLAVEETVAGDAQAGDTGALRSHTGTP